MSKIDRVTTFLSDVADSPMASRRQRLAARKASLWGRAVALGFLLGIATSVGLWLYDLLTARSRSSALAAQSPLAQH
jgi:hypothetical protein